MNITNLYISGLNTFQVVGSDYDSSTQTYTLYIDTPTTQLLGQYSMVNEVIVAGVPINMTGDGFLDMESVDGRVVISFNFGTGADGNLFMENLIFKNMSCGEFHSRNTGFMENINYTTFLNSVFESGMNLLNSELSETIMAPYADMLMNTFNPLLKQFQTVEQLTSALVIGTGNSTVGEFGLPLCQ